ncbi:MAG: hypothetical protein ACK4I0_03460 [Brevundimonas sp.]|uniref:hypothetical protein n=1 Tax=Brevundimonas sp. TaxID=1871086 RepID=UPI003918A7DC
MRVRRRLDPAFAGMSGCVEHVLAVPASGGSVEPMAAGPGVTVNIRMDGGAPSLLRSEAQIAQMLARATALGARRL